MDEGLEHLINLVMYIATQKEPKVCLHECELDSTLKANKQLLKILKDCKRSRDHNKK